MTERALLITPEAALALLEKLAPTQKLNDTQQAILRYSLQRQTYPEMAEQLGYEATHVRDLAYQLWRQLSRLLGEKVGKNNVAAVLWRYETLEKDSPKPNSKE